MLPLAQFVTRHSATKPPAGMLSNLPAAVTTFASCPVPVGVAGDRGSASGTGGDSAVVLASVTAAGGLEVATMRRGALSPLTAAVSLSLGELQSLVRWLSQAALHRLFTVAVLCRLPSLQDVKH